LIVKKCKQADGFLKDQVAIVTGGASGIGKAVCVALAEEEVRVVAVDVSTTGVQETIGELRSRHGGQSFLSLVLDVRQEQAMEEMVHQTLNRFGGLDILVHCAGILRLKGTSPKPLVDLTIAEWDAVLDTNLKGTFLSNRAVLPTMIAQRKGNIINISSTYGRSGHANDAAYCASKFGVIGVSEAVAEEVRQYGVRLQVLLPDAVDTPLWDQNGPVPRPGNTLPAARVAEFVVCLLAMPDDSILLNPVIAPFRTRRRIEAKRQSAS
jgi:3-oxoacyl-[acyl-carrier protein] reductase